MKTDIGIWQIDPSSQAGVKLPLAERVETEEMLEAVLVTNPDMLMRGLTLVARQVPVETGFIDLLGIDEDGRLVVFELKREKLTRAAVAQVLDYCTYLETLSDSELATLLAERSGKGGIGQIPDFEEWYGSQRGESIRPVRMVLVGLGLDVSAHLCHGDFEQLKKAISFEAVKPPNAPTTRRAPNQWYCRLDERSWQHARGRLIAFVRAVEDAWREHERRLADESGGS